MGLNRRKALHLNIDRRMLREVGPHFSAVLRGHQLFAWAHFIPKEGLFPFAEGIRISVAPHSEGTTMNLDEVLTQRHVPHERLHHRPTYTANRMAQVLHVPGKEVAKSVLLRSGQGYVLAVLPATHYVDLERLRAELGEERLEMASEKEMDQIFPDCERGALPPFGSFYHVPTVVDESLTGDEAIVFEGQTHEDAIRMTYRDYEALEHPVKRRFAHRL
jgi:Ala-tRNA(Pro) deacylase